MTWDNPGDTAIDKWQYRQSATEAGLDTASWTDIGSSDADTTTHTVTGLNAGGTYFFEVRPYTTDGLDAVDIVGKETSGDFAGVTLWTAFSNVADAVAGTVTGLGASAHYLRIQAVNTGGASPESDSVLATPKIPDNGTWTYQVVVNPNRILPDSGAKAEVSLVAAWRAAASERPEITTLSVNGAGSAYAEVDVSDPQPQVVGFGTSSTGTLSTTSFAASPPGNCVTAIGAGTITCTLHITSRNTDLYAASGAGGTYNVYVRPGSGFSLAAVVNRIESDTSEPANDDIPTGRLNVSRPPPTGGGGTSRDTVTANNSDETIGVTINKPASVTLDVAVRDQSCAAAAPAGTVHLCVQASASGALENLAASPAFMTIVISPESWGQMEEAYNADPRRFFLSKRSSPGQAWANIAWCLDDPAVECYLLQETEQGGATMFVYNIVSFSQYAIRTVSVDGVGGGGSCVGINCRAVIIGGGGTGRGPQHRLPATTRTPAPTARPTATPTVRPTLATPTPRPTVRPTLVPPTPQPTVAPPTPRPTDRPTVVPPTVAPPTQPPQRTATAPAPVATPPPPTVAPTPPPPPPTEAPTPEPTGETAALPPPTEPVPAITAVPPAVEPGGNLTMWLIIVIVIAVAAVGGMGFVAFRLLRAQ